MRRLCWFFLLLILVFGGCVYKYETVTVFPSSESFLYNIANVRGGRSGRVKGAIYIKPGESAQIAAIKGPAVIHHFWCTLRCESNLCLAEQVLRIWWDNEPQPSVEVPLGDFFAVGFGRERFVNSFLIEMIPTGGMPNHTALNCYIPMPFSDRAVIKIENQGEKPVTHFIYKINYERLNRIPASWGRFHAQWRRENPVKRGVPYTILYAEGKGRYLGTVMNYHILEPGSWVEGGEDFYIDGESKPTLPGIGAEDYFGFSWGFRKEFGSLFHGTSYGPEGAYMTAYRFHILDPIRFKKSLRVTMRCHGWDVQDREDDYSSVAYWYQSEPHKPFPALPPLSERLPEEILHNPAPPNE